jgi:hypothetical protein
MKSLRWLAFVPGLAIARATEPHLGTRGLPIIEQDGLRFKDLDRNGKLDRYEVPFDLPPSMSAVLAQRSDLAHDIPHPLYRFGYGLRY